MRKRLEAQGGSAADWHRLGELLLVEHRFEAALDAMGKAVDLAPGNTRFVSGLALALSWNRRYEDAIRTRQSLQHLGGRDIAAQADDLKYAHDFAGAIALVDAAEAAGRADAAAKVIRGIARLYLGDHRAGFADMENRFDAGLTKLPDTLPRTRWDGTPAPGLRLLVCPDQGLGDDIMMIRFLPALADAGVAATFLARAPLEALLRASPLGAAVQSRVSDLSAFDAWCPVGSLPHLLGCDPAPPPPTPLSVPDTSMRFGQATTAPYADAFRIGVCWTGNPQYPRNAMRSATPRLFEPLARRDGVALFSLCFGDDVAALAETGMDGAIVDACATADFADTAGVIAHMDLVITTDTALAHLAASLGAPTWNLLPTEGFWQYGATGEATPWYPSMRLFRQPRRGDWDGVMARVGEALTERLQARSGTTNRSS
ncbi:MAG: hypothetical protein KDE22_06050 [Rhodobacterales bacterium]|nr:hypothetical protein [Rhodobacterales bacterium]